MIKSQRRRSPARAIEQPTAFENLDVSPLIDVGFLLLIFFLVTSSLRREETGLPTTGPGKEQKGTPIETLIVDLRVTADGAVSVNDKVLAADPNLRSMPAVVAELEAAKKLAKASGGLVQVQIEADDDLAHQRFADVLNAVRTAQIEHVALDDLR